MKIVITGAAGFVGRHMISFFRDRGHEVIGVDRNPPPESPNGSDRSDGSTFSYYQSDTTKPGEWQQAIAESDAVFNLAGKNIFGRWTEKTKAAIIDSRIQTTRRVVEAFSGNKEAVLLNTSAVGYYGDKGEAEIDESGSPGDDFLSRVSIEWEKEALKARDKGVRVAIMRFGLIMGTDGGALPMMVPAYKSFAGGPLGSGKQFMPWIHIEDLMRAYEYTIDNPGLEGPINCTAPHPVRNEEFAKTLASVLNRPAIFKVPRFALKLAMGELGDLMLNSQRAIPAKLEQSGFEFNYPRLKEALADLLS